MVDPASKDNLYSPECQQRSGQLHEPQRQTPSSSVQDHGNQTSPLHNLILLQPRIKLLASSGQRRTHTISLFNTVKLLWHNLHCKQRYMNNSDLAWLVFALFRQENNSKHRNSTVLCLWATWRRFVPKLIIKYKFKWFGSNTMTHFNSNLLPPTGGFNFTFKVSFHFFISYQISLSTFYA